MWEERRPVIVVVDTAEQRNFLADAFQCTTITRENVELVLKGMRTGEIYRVVGTANLLAIGFNFQFPAGKSPMMLDMSTPSPGRKEQLRGRIERIPNFPLPSGSYLDAFETYTKLMRKARRKRNFWERLKYLFKGDA